MITPTTNRTGLRALETASVGTPVTRGNVSLFPVYAHGQDPPEVEAGVTALTEGTVTVGEIGGGSVPTLVVRSQSPVPVLFPEGDTLAGGKQNRTLNVSVLVAPGTDTELPVSCVEAGRWGGARPFEHGQAMAPRRVRRAKTDSILTSPHPAARRSDQQRVWAEIDAEFARTGATSPTRSVHDATAPTDQRLRPLRALRPLPDQVGVVATYGRQVLGLDLFATPHLLATYWEPIVASYATDLTDKPASARPSTAVVARSLRHLANRHPDRNRGHGIGTELTIRSRYLVGSGITLDGHLIHLSAFGRSDR